MNTWPQGANDGKMKQEKRLTILFRLPSNQDKQGYRNEYV